MTPEIPLANPGDKWCITVLNPPGTRIAEYWREGFEALQAGLGELGIKAPVLINRFLPGALPILFGSYQLKIDCLSELPAGTIIYNTEPLRPGAFFFDERFLTILRRFPVWDYSLRNMQVLRESGHPAARHVPLGYVPQFTRIGVNGIQPFANSFPSVTGAEAFVHQAHDPADVQDTDVLFYGVPAPRRKGIVEQLRARGLRVGTLFRVFGPRRDAWIARTKLVLNIHREEGGLFESFRILYLLANRKAVLSEEAGDMDPEFRSGLAMCPYDRLVSTAVDLVADENERQRLAEVGFQIVTRPEWRMSRTLSSMPEFAGLGSRGVASIRGQLPVAG